MSDRRPTQPIIGEAPAFLEMLEHVSRAAPLDKPVLVVGERGTGKELIASRLHFLSERWEQAVIKVNCAALTESILESELFGHEAGAFTGAVRTHVQRNPIDADLFQIVTDVDLCVAVLPVGPR